MERVGDKDRIAMPLFPRYVKVRDIIRSVRRSPHGDRAALEKYMADVRRNMGAAMSVLKALPHIVHSFQMARKVLSLDPLVSESWTCMRWRLCGRCW